MMRRWVRLKLFHIVILVTELYTGESWFYEIMDVLKKKLSIIWFWKMNLSLLNICPLFDHDKSIVLFVDRKLILHGWRSVKDTWIMKWVHFMVKILKFFSLIQIVTDFLRGSNQLLVTIFMRFRKIYF